MIIDEETHDELLHYGTPRRSGRYPWGTSGWGAGGLDVNPRNMSFHDFVRHMKKQGLSETHIAAGLGISTTQLRAKVSIERASKKAADISMAQRLRDKGMSPSAIARRMQIPDSTARSLLRPGEESKADVITKTAEVLQRRVDQPPPKGATKTLIDVGTGTEASLGVSKDRLNAVLAVLREKGYVVHPIKVPQIGTKFETINRVLCPPGTTWGEAKKNMYNIQPVSEFSQDGGHTFAKIHSPLSINANRVQVVYKEDGGDKADGMIYVRRGVKDVALGGTPYAQVRVQVGDAHYLKGMAVYKDGLPPGTDLQFHTSKSKHEFPNKLDVMKNLSDDKNLPFESIVRQVIEDVGTSKERVTSVMNIVSSSAISSVGNVEGSWESWTKSLASQFLSKQRPTLAKAQLSKTEEKSRKDFEEINSLTNPTVKKFLLDKFADTTDSTANNLEAAALSTRQAWHVILPLNSLKPTEVYAPRFNDGERVVLVRYPHGGTFEIPELTVNNKHPEGKRLLGDARDAIGIHHSVAERLSGADFDGDTVVVIPNNNKKVVSSPALEALKNFNPREAYPGYPGMVNIGTRKQQLMGDVSNLITDMTIKNAPHRDIARAIKHSMVVIDADKHNLNYKQSFIDNGIADLKREYQSNSKSGRGASTLISRAKSELHVPERKPRPAAEGGPVDAKTGEKRYAYTERKRSTRTGKVIDVTEKTTKLAETQDAHTLSSGTIMERIYADHANRMKQLANSARLTSLKTPRLQYSDSAKRVYSKEVESLNSKLTLALQNRPLERQAQVIAGSMVKAIRQANPNLTGDTLKKIEYAELEKARARLGASKKDRAIAITPNEWDAIQAGAISNSKLVDILKNTNVDQVRKYATPRRVHLLTPTKTEQAKSMLNEGYTRAEVAKRFGVSLTTLDTSTKGE